MIEIEEVEYKIPVGRLAMFGLGKALVHVEAPAAEAYGVARKALVAKFYGKIGGVEGGRVCEYAPGRCEVEFIVELIPGEGEAFYGEEPIVVAIGC